jgi:putative transposase
MAASPEVGETAGMKPPPDPHYRHQFPAEVISYAVWLYRVFSRSLRHVELLLADRGVVVSYETVRRWCKKSAESFADRLHRRRPRPGDKCTWTMSSSGSRACSTTSGAPVDQNDVVLDILVRGPAGCGADCFPASSTDKAISEQSGRESHRPTR